MTEQILTLLIAERDKLNRAIEALQGPTKRRGRPPKNPLTSIIMTGEGSSELPTKKARKFSAAQRKAAGDRMRAMWAAKKLVPAASKTAKAKKTAKTE